MLIQKLRLQRGWSQEQLADISGLSARTIQRLEGGQPGSLESMNALAAAFDVDLEQLKEPSMHPSQGATSADVRADEALALAHVRKVRGFYIHLAQYVIVILGLAAINLFSSARYLWFLWPALGWGIAVLSHGVAVFGRLSYLGGAWERREVEKYLGRRL